MPLPVRYAAAARKALRKGMSSDQAVRIMAKVAELAADPNAPNLDRKKLEGSESWRLRVGEYRVIYQIVEQSDERGGTHRILIVSDIGHRREIYR
jgi:mRNA interferase RelE/StbE